MKLRVNGQSYDVQVDPGTPLLWVLRDAIGLPGTKFGCGIGQCGACTVHLDGQPVRSCSFPVSGVGALEVRTIEALDHPVKAAWIAHQVPQCGYCQPGQLMAAAALLDSTPAPTDDQISAKMTNICRCGTYPRIRAAIHSVAAKGGSGRSPETRPGAPTRVTPRGEGVE